ncbi:CheR family methyltransferase [Luteibacter sp. CQ10]|uniref:CheR family methyltransferase n=1 Tax=Luteibacter sp. CQ10 TaxID=2805821 RepID=UPI0034A0F6C9
MSQTPSSDDVASPALPLVLALGTSGTDEALLAKLVAALPASDELVVVLVPRNRMAFNLPRFRQWLGERADRLHPMADDEALRGGRCYLVPPDVLATLDNGRFRLVDTGGVMARGTIDTFFVSMAKEMQGHAIGTVLGDTGGEGTLGIVALKEAGGLTLAVVGDDAEEAEPAHSGSPAALADEILDVEAFARRVASYVAQRKLSPGNEDDPERLNQVAVILRNHTGHDFHGYKRATFARRVERRMQVVQAPTVAAYVDVLRARPDEAQQLFNDLLIGVTQFFRDTREFEFLESNVIPRLFEGKNRSDTLRIWVLGCSTGEEAYSLAILLREYASTLDTPPHVQIFASDIDGRGLAVARVGRYPPSIADDVGPERLERWFTKEGETYSVSKELREMCVFSQHSIVKDPPFSRLDLISCRNLLIYLDNELQDQVIPVFHFALKPGGHLFLGNSENVSRHTRLFAPVERSYRIFHKVDAGTRLAGELRVPESSPPAPPSVELPRARVPNMGLMRLGERIAERHAPAYAIVDMNHEVLHFSAQAGRYIHPGGGTPTLNLLNLVHRDLRLDLRAALGRAALEDRTVRLDGLPMTEGGEPQLVDLIVEPTSATSTGERGFVVLFKEGMPVVAPTGNADSGGAHEERIQALDAELRITRERLQAMIEELESANEELKASNEEYQSLNEELQSSNEELETSKEELQSVNEEVTTVNGELAHRVQELAHANSDLKNLLESTRIATVFLDNELRITNFTPAVAEIVPLVETDIHRPISHIRLKVAYDELLYDVRKVIRTLVTVDREVENPETQARYIVRVLPYRSVDNYIGGAVVTFHDVTPLSRAERALRESEQRLRTLMEGIPQLVWRAVDGGQWTWSSPQWSAFTGQTAGESVGMGWLDAIHPDDREDTARAWRDTADAGFINIEHRIRAKDGAYRWFHTRSRPVHDERHRIVEWLGTSTDVDDLRTLQEEQRVMVSELQHRTRNLISVVQSIALQTTREAESVDLFRTLFDDRLGALSRVQGVLSQSEADPITVGDLILLELDALASGGGRERIRLEGPDVRLRKSAVQTLSLALHELATNARKYGALAAEDGQISVTWRKTTEDGEQRLVLEWLERGVSPDAWSGNLGTGYGRTLIEHALPYTLGARTEFHLDADGLRCVVDLPLDRRDSSPGS